MAHILNRRDIFKLTSAALATACGGDRPEARGDGSTAAKGAVAGAGATIPVSVGEQVLASGGNAADAAVATALTACVTEPSSCGLAGYGGHMVIALARENKITAIDFNSTAPAAAREDMFAPDSRGVAPEAHDHGWLSAGVPGTAAGLYLAAERYGTRSFRDLLAPAIRLAREGFELDEMVAGNLRSSEKILRKDPGSMRLFFEDEKPLTAGALFRNPDLASVLEALAESNSAEPFYRGEIARRIASAFQKNGGIVTAEDFAAYQAREVEAVRLDWRGYSIHTAPLTAGGTSTLGALSILKALAWEEYTDPNRKNHARLEALRIAWNDRLSLFGDPQKVDVPVERLLSAEYAEEAAVKVRSAVEKGQPLEISTSPRDQDGTVHLSVVDGDGNMVALTLTHGAGLGARVTVDGLGLILGHGMSRFDAAPGRANSPGPGKRPLNNMCPTVVLRDGRPILGLGGRGGRRIPNAVFDVLSRFIGEDHSMEESVSAPRMHTEGDLKLFLDDQWDPPQTESLQKIGYEMERAQSARVSAVAFDHRTRQGSVSAR